MFYVTTSKGAGKAAIELCGSLASVLPRAVFERRGGKPIESVVSRARRLGKVRVLIVGAGSLQAIAVSATGWDWLGDGMKIKGAKCNPAPAEPPESISASGKLAEIFGMDGAGDVVARLSKGVLAFTCGRRKAGPEIMLVD